MSDPETGRAAWWEPQYMYDSSSYLINKTTPGCVPDSGAMPRTTAAGDAMYNNPDYTFGGVHVPCVNNTQVPPASLAWLALPWPALPCWPLCCLHTASAHHTIIVLYNLTSECAG